MRPQAVDVILNRRARHLGDDASPLREALLREARAGSARVHETWSLEELDDVARDIATRGEGRVVLAGGDGSHMAGVTALARALGGELSNVTIALAPGGTVCTVARNWGMRATPDYAASLVRAAVAGGGEVIARPTLRARDDAGGDRVGFIFGAGLVASFFEVYYASPHAGYLGAARIVGRIFAGSFTGGELARRVLTPVPCAVEVDGEERGPRAWSLIVASVVRDLGLHMLVTYRAGEDDHRFHAVASPLAPRQLGPQLPRVLLGRRLAGADHVDALARSMRVRFTGAGGGYVLDGEMLAASAVEVTCGPTLRVLTLARVRSPLSR